METTITNAQRKELLAYLSKRPYSEVYLLVAMLVGLKPKSNGKQKDNVTSKNYWVQRLNYTKNIKHLHHKLSGIGLKTLAFLVCLICWAIIILAHFSQLN